jgi:hypothetical protein
MVSDPSDNKLDAWAIVELMGHRKLAGRVSEQIVAGAAMLRIDVPELEGLPAFTQLYGTSAIYCLTFTTQEVALKVAAFHRERPVSVYELKSLPAAAVQMTIEEE